MKLAEKVAAKIVEPAQHRFEDDTVFPNSRLPVLIYRAAIATPKGAAFEELFEAHGWSSAWRNGLYTVTTITARRTKCSASSRAGDRAPGRTPRPDGAARGW